MNNLDTEYKIDEIKLRCNDFKNEHNEQIIKISSKYNIGLIECYNGFIYLIQSGYSIYESLVLIDSLVSMVSHYRSNGIDMSINKILNAIEEK